MVLLENFTALSLDDNILDNDSFSVAWIGDLGSRSLDDGSLRLSQSLWNVNFSLTIWLDVTWSNLLLDDLVDLSLRSWLSLLVDSQR